MKTTGGGYVKLVWWKAWSFAWSATRSWSGLAAIALGIVALRVEYMREWRMDASWEIPLALLAILLVYGFGRSSYALYAEREAEANDFRERLTDYQNHKALADELTERYEMATHHLLNVVARDKPPSEGWIEQAHIWRVSVLAILNKYDCVKQEITHFEVINQFEVWGLNLPYEIAMFLIRVGRLTDLTNSHVRIADEQRLRPKRA